MIHCVGELMLHHAIRARVLLSPVIRNHMPSSVQRYRSVVACGYDARYEMVIFTRAQMLSKSESQLNLANGTKKWEK